MAPENILIFTAKGNIIDNSLFYQFKTTTDTRDDQNSKNSEKFKFLINIYSKIFPIGIINTKELNEAEKQNSLTQCSQYLDNSPISIDDNVNFNEIGH